MKKLVSVLIASGIMATAGPVMANGWGDASYTPESISAIPSTRDRSEVIQELIDNPPPLGMGDASSALVIDRSGPTLTREQVRARLAACPPVHYGDASPLPPWFRESKQGC